MTDLARYYFVPTVREGLASLIEGTPSGSRATITTRVTPIADQAPRSEIIEKQVALFGPGDVLGFDSSVVIRTDPPIGTWDYEPNYMPTVEFSEPDFPWRLTPAAADANGRLMPWLTLIALVAEADKEFSGLGERKPANDEKNTSLARWIQGVHLSALPDLTHAWKWAHVQVTSHDGLNKDNLVGKLSANEPDVENKVVARLICPRRLAPKTRYVGFVVPTFKIAQVAAGLIPNLAEGESVLTPAWNASDPLAPGKIDLPYYYQWEFATGVRGDFEYLVKLLEPRALTGLGKRRMAVSELPYGLPVVRPDAAPEDREMLEIEGALKSPELQSTPWGEGSAPDPFQTALADVLNLPSLRIEEKMQKDTVEVPLITPPVYGRWHVGRETVKASEITTWQPQVNLDPRLRAAAGAGSLVIEKEQEPLMAALWEQLGSIDEANEIVRRAQLGVGASKSVFDRLNRFNDTTFLSVAAPVFGRTRLQPPDSKNPVSVAHHLQGSPIPSGAFDPAFRRVLRKRGGIRNRQHNVGKPAKGQELLTRLNEKELNKKKLIVAGPPPQLGGLPTLEIITAAAVARVRQLGARPRSLWRIEGWVREKHEKETDRILPGIRVEAWDSDRRFLFDDLVGSAVTDKNGYYTIEFDSKYFRYGLLNRQPDLYFKLFRVKDNDSILIATIRSNLWKNLKPGKLTSILDVPIGWESITIERGKAEEKITKNRLEFHIQGAVIDPQQVQSVKGLRVEAWDKDFILANDLVGSAMTDGKGEFKIDFDSSYFEDWIPIPISLKKLRLIPVDPLPDIFFKVYRGNLLILSTEKTKLLRNLKPGEVRPVSLVLEAEPKPSDTDIDVSVLVPGAEDFCEESVSCTTLREVVSRTGDLRSLHTGAAEAICGAIEEWLGVKVSDADVRKPVDLPKIAAGVRTEIDPKVTIAARTRKRLRLGPGIHQQNPFARIESEVDFPQPMYESLTAISKDFILPGVETVPQNTIAILETNRRFVEAYMLGLCHSMAGEALWRGAPVYLWTTFFRQFWDVRGLVDGSSDGAERYKDIERLAKWSPSSKLGEHDPRGAGQAAERAVLLIRGDLLRRYDDVQIYAVPSSADGQPMIDSSSSGTEFNRLNPIFTGTLPSDLTFLGFDLSAADLCSGGKFGKGYFIVLEEHLSQPRFGFDLPDSEDKRPDGLPSSPGWWYKMTWAHLQRPQSLAQESFEPFPENGYINDRVPMAAADPNLMWDSSAAVIANISLQRPVRVAIHASRLIPNAACK